MTAPGCSPGVDTDTDSDNPDRVLIITQFFPPESMGGAHRWREFSKHMPESIESHVVCPPPAFPFGEFDRMNRPWRSERVDGVSVTRLWTYQPSENGTSLGRILNYAVFAILAAVYVLAKGRRYDCVVTVSSPHTTFLSGLLAKALRTNWVVDIYDTWLENAADTGYVEQGSVGYLSIAVLERLTFRYADHVLVVSDTMERYYREKHGLTRDIFSTVPFGIDQTWFDPAPYDNREKKVLYTGNLGACQAFGPFFRAFAMLDDDWELVIVGDGDRRTELEQLATELGIADRTTFLGAVSRNRIPELIAASRVTWVPLRTDHNLDYARPTKLLESMAVGTPYVASNVCEIKHVTNRSSAGFAVQNEPEQIADALRTCLTNDDRAESMGERGVEFIRENHRWGQLSERVARAFIEVT